MIRFSALQRALDWCVPADRERILGQIDGLVRLCGWIGRVLA